MTLSTRIAALEDKNLSPKEAVICWMREAHQFDSFFDYGLWLIDQPDDVYPLVRMPSQVVEAIRSRNKGTADVCLREDFYRAQRDVLSLFFIHKDLNMRVTADLESIRLRLSLLTEGLRSIISQAYMVDTLRLERLEFPKDLSKPMPRREKQPHEIALEETIATWDSDETRLHFDVKVLLATERMLSARYLEDEPLFFDDSRRKLEATAAILPGLRDTYHDVLRHRPPEEDKDFICWMGAKANDESPPPPEPEKDPDPDKPRTRAEARAFAEHIVVVARSQALSMLGEKDAGIRAVTDWMKASRES